MNRGMTPSDADRILASLQDRLLAQRGTDGCWEGRLSSSALSTAVAIFALWRQDAAAHAILTRQGLQWLMVHVNADGGWGDTVRSGSNLSATLLAWATCRALSIDDGGADEVCTRATDWIVREVGSTEPAALVDAVLGHYGVDRTFSVPILTMLAIAGCLGEGPAAWGCIPPLPFELAVLPRRVFGWLRLPVVSYALPALIGMGLARHRCGPRTCLGPLRRAATPRALRVLEQLQPEHGGFLEAAPLTGFVAMSLCAAGEARHAVTRRACDFLRQSVREDGSWPIDTNLATWVTSLSVAALMPGKPLGDDTCRAIREPLLARQFQQVHPFTDAEPGGWAWTDLPGGTPDADDTAAALIALHRLGDLAAVRGAAARGASWLLGLQNRDGGVPTFCRGWGRLPFDRSSPDITAHALQALDLWAPDCADPLLGRVERGMRRMRDYLAGAQRHDGAWVPLWFGNAAAPAAENPVYGTARVLAGLVSPGVVALVMRQRGYTFLRGAQHRDGGWGGDAGVTPSVEETALAVTALSGADDSPSRAAMAKGVSWLTARWDREQAPPATPIGLYFASLWYYEELYPLIFSVDALRRYTEQQH